MSNKNSILGITLEQNADDGVYICYIEDFSDDLKEEIRNMLGGIWHGVVDATEDEDIFNYKETLKDFLERYKKKSLDIKKGIIGELLSHLLIPKYISEFEVISIMKNKEEKSIRKGFDIVYYNNIKNSIWYCEVKSGGDEDCTEINTKNRERLGRAKSKREGIIKHAFGYNTILWQSVLKDVKSTIFDSKKQLNIKKLLKEDYPTAKDRNMDRNVILSSVLYKSLDNKICPNNLRDYKINIDKEKIFIGLVIFSIQKPTYKKIEEFLITESN